jgi:hypothetical protein
MVTPYVGASPKVPSCPSNAYGRTTSATAGRTVLIALKAQPLLLLMGMYPLIRKPQIYTKPATKLIIKKTYIKNNNNTPLLYINKFCKNNKAK